MDLDTTRWSGEGVFTQTLIDAFQRLDQVARLRVEDVPSSRSDVEYNFISNELFVGFRTRDRGVRAKWLGLLGVVLASVNIFGGFAVTARMLAMYKKKEKK